MPGRVLVLHGPNLDLLGRREPEVYGHTTLEEIDEMCRRRGKRLGLEVECRQSNSEGEPVGWAREAPDDFDAVVLNASAYSHTSVPLLDALRSLNKPLIEVYLSHIYR